MLEFHTGGSQRRRIGQIGRRQPGDALAIDRQRGQCRQQTPQFSHAFVCDEDLGERAYRPAATRQLAVEHRESARHCPIGIGRGSAAAPDDLAAKNFLKGRHGYCIFIQYR